MTTTHHEPPGPAALGVPKRGMRSRLRRLDERGTPLLFVSPFFLMFLAFGIFPLAYTAWVSMHEWQLLSDDHVFIGFDNYVALFEDPFFWNALWNTLSLLVLATVPQLFLALWIAHLLNSRLRAPTFWRMGILLPNITSIVAVTVVFTSLFGRDFGLFNWILGWFGVENIDWRAHVWSSHLAISLMVIWRWTGYNALIYLAAMQAIPKEMYESATLDGASTWKQFWQITVPLLRPTIIFTVIVSTIGGLQLFTEPLMFDPSPGNATGGSDRQFQTLAVYMFEKGFRNFDFGYASTIAWMMFLVIVVIAAINFLFVRRIRSAS